MRAVAILAFTLVRSQIGDDVPRDITGPELLPTGALDSASFWGWLLPLVFLALIPVGFFLIRFLKSKSRRMTAADHALRQLDRLQGLQLLQKNPKDHFKLLAGILRRYFERGFGVAASRLTTDEFLDRAARTPRIEGHLSFLRTFLGDCDIAKFAPPSAAFDRARDLEASLRTWLAAQNAPSNSPAALDAAAVPSKMSDS
jgi:hypothetical protein